MLSVFGGCWNHYSFRQMLEPVTDPLAIPDQQTGCCWLAAFPALRTCLPLFGRQERS